MSTGTKAEQIAPFSTESTTLSSSVYFIIMGSVVSSLVAPAAAMHAAGFKNLISSGMLKKERSSRNRLLKKATLPYALPDNAPMVTPPRLYQPMQLAMAVPSARG